jgi:hypothetical protein
MIYAIYKGDNLLAMGKSYEVTNKLGIDVKTLYNYCAPSRHKSAENSKKPRTLGYRLREDEE